MLAKLFTAPCLKGSPMIAAPMIAVESLSPSNQINGPPSKNKVSRKNLKTKILSLILHLLNLS